MTVASTYNIVDSVYVGRLGAEALAAMSVTYPLNLSFITLAAGTGVGVTSLISRYLGAGERRKVDMLTFFAGLVLIVIEFMKQGISFKWALEEILCR
jgi:Na+-driven multidrug efflux pump